MPAENSTIDSIAKISAAMRASFVGDRRVLADGRAPLHTLTGPFPCDFQAPLAQPDAGRRQRQPARVQCGQRDAQSFAFGKQDILAWHLNIGEPYHSVVKRFQAHETATLQ